MTYQVLLFYKYVTVDEPEVLANELRARASENNLKGRIIISEEGVNGTVEGLYVSTEAFAVWLQSDVRFRDMNVKRSEGTGEAFPKLKVKVRREIVGTRFPAEVDPRVKTGKRVSAETLKEWFSKKEDFVVVDMRNDYEYASGHFDNSINLGMKNSRDLPEVIGKIASLSDKKVVTVCTGGVRCEKMSAYLQHQGFKNVFQLENGIHSYMERYPGEDFLGTLYTFDQRKTMHFGGERDVVGRCHLCNAASERYVNCSNAECHYHFIVCTICVREDAEALCNVCLTKKKTSLTSS